MTASRIYTATLAIGVILAGYGVLTAPDREWFIAVGCSVVILAVLVFELLDAWGYIDVYDDEPA